MKTLPTDHRRGATMTRARRSAGPQLFRLPFFVEYNEIDTALGRALVEAWQTDGGFRVPARLPQEAAAERALNAARGFFREPADEKSGYVSDLSYSGYSAAGPVTPDGSRATEAFTVCPDVPVEDRRVREGWPCHGPVPWSSPSFEAALKGFSRVASDLGHRVLQLIALGLDLGDMNHFRRLTDKGWHHMRAVRSLPADAFGRGLRHPSAALPSNVLGEPFGGSALLVVEVHDDDGVSPPREFNVLPGDVMDFLTGGAVPAAPCSPAPDDHERHTLTFFHAPAFQAVARPLDRDADAGNFLHYGTHRTGMFMRGRPDCPATARIEDGAGLLTLARLRHDALRTSRPQQML